ncbi:MAG: SigE family RNA polymerase sigma factor [Nocardioidaceae bacterium]
MREADESEYAEFFAATWDRLFRSTYAVARDFQLAEDALQSAFAKAYRSWRRVRTADRPEAYVRRMAINEVLGVRRRAWWKAERHSESVDHTGSPSHEDAVLRHDEVWGALLALPPRQRAVIVLRYYEDLSEQQIADALGCRPGTVKSQASAALDTLRHTLDDDLLAQQEDLR